MPEHPSPKKPRPALPSAPIAAPGAIAYAELHAKSNFSFLQGASHPDELVVRAAELGYRAIALTDEASLAGVVRAHVAAKACGIHLIIGAELRLRDQPGTALVVHARDRAAYGRLSRLLTLGRRRVDRVGGEKASAYELTFDDVAAHAEGLAAVVCPGDQVERAELPLARARELFGERASLALELHRGPDDRARTRAVQALSMRLGVPLAVANDVHFHDPERHRLAAVVAAIREGTPLERAGRLVFANAERHLRPLAELARLYREVPGALARSVELAEACRFSLDELRYEYPEELVPEGHTPASWLRALTEEGARARYPDGVPPDVRRQIEHELALVAELGYEPYFLTVHDIVRFARGRGILCQGRGSAANSAVCFCLGVTSVDPSRIEVLFERFVSRARKEPPDIDVDFEHERREEVLQYVYEKYGRDRAGMTAEVITYRGRSAVRDVGKALGLSLDQVDRLAKAIDWDAGELAQPDRGPRLLQEAGLDPEDRTTRLVVALAGEIQGFPRHLSQHVGGMVIARGLLTDLVPIQNASMPGRTFIEWDKDDLDSLGLLKVDCLALGMLTCIRKAFDLLRGAGGPSLELATLPPEDPAVYDMLCAADAIGVFQVESRAQMNMLPRLRPRTFYDLVVEVSIVRPGPIQGGIVHPYLRRRRGEESVRSICPEADRVLAKTLGVPVFQEQAMRLAIDVAGFSPDEADALRKAMGAWRKVGSIEKFAGRFIQGVMARGVSEDQAKELFERIHGFGEYGFPECVSGETRVIDAETGRWVAIEDVAHGRTRVEWTLSCDEELRIRRRRVQRVWASGRKPTFRLRTALGREVVATAEHPFLTVEGWRKLGELEAGEAIAAARTPDDGVLVEWDRIVSIEPAGERETYDLQVDGDHNFLANDLVVHNSHAASFALLVYASAWLKRYHPAAFAAGLLNAQPMGFYQPAQIVRDAREHGVRVLPVCVQSSGWDVRLEDAGAGADAPPRSGAFGAGGPGGPGGPAMRLGMRLVKGMRESAARAIEAARREGPFRSLGDLARRTGLGREPLERLAGANAFASLGLGRREATFDALARAGPEPPLFRGLAGGDARVELPPLSEIEGVVADYASFGLTLERHPVAHVRAAVEAAGGLPTAALATARDGERVSVAGLVICRQRPATASGIVFFTIEDETGTANLIVRPDVFERHRRAARGAKLLLATGKVEREGPVIHVLVRQLRDLSGLFAKASRDGKEALRSVSRDFH